MTDDEILSRAHRTCTKYIHGARVRFGFSDSHLIHFVRQILEQRNQEETPEVSPKAQEGT